MKFGRRLARTAILRVAKTSALSMRGRFPIRPKPLEGVRPFELDLDLGRMKAHRPYLTDVWDEGWNFAVPYLTLMNPCQA